MICAPCSRASSRIFAASARASASCALYFSSAAFASAWACLASFMPPSIASVRSAYAFSNFGTTNLAKAMASRIRKTKPKMISAVCGTTGWGFSPRGFSQR